MRVEQAVKDLFSNGAFIQKVNFLSQMKGGWERWFQMELAYYIATTCGKGYRITLEDSTVYPDTALRADLVMQYPYLSQTTTVVELKCQVAGGDTGAFVGMVAEDIEKGAALEPGDDYQVIALVQDRRELEDIYHELACAYPNKVSRHRFLPDLQAPGGFVHFYEIAK